MQAVYTLFYVTANVHFVGGWLLRKSWKIYDKVYKEISQNFEESKRNGKVKVKVESVDMPDPDDSEPGECLKVGEYYFLSVRTAQH